MIDKRRPNKLSPASTRGYDQVIDFFSNIGLSREASMYVKMFRDIVPWRFAVLLISAETLERSVKAVALDLAYLCGLNLYPVIVLDNLQVAGGNLVRPAAQSGSQKLKAPGRRIRDLVATSSRLVSAVTAAGGKAAGVHNEIFSLRTPQPEKPDFDFRILAGHLNLAPLKSLVKNRHIPVISPVAMDSRGQLRMISAEKVAKALCKRIEPQKFIVISEQGGILDRRGELIRNIILSTDYKSLIASGELDENALQQLEAGVRVLREVPNLTLQFASAGNLLYELFTVKGQGTYIRAGHEIREARSFKGLDLERLRELIEDGFDKTLVEDYFREAPHRVLYERNYHGVIVVKPLEGDIFYLDKFVVGRRWQGEGMGAPLWRELTKHYAKLIWRASPHNPINRWYLDQAEGFQRTPEWNIYWIGLTPKEVGQHIERVMKTRRTVV